MKELFLENKSLDQVYANLIASEGCRRKIKAALRVIKDLLNGSKKPPINYREIDEHIKNQRLRAYENSHYYQIR